MSAFTRLVSKVKLVSSWIDANSNSSVLVFTTSPIVTGKRRHEFEDIFLDEGIRINRIQAKFLVELMRKQTIRKKLANDLEKFAKGIEEEEYYDWHS